MKEAGDEDRKKEMIKKDMLSRRGTRPGHCRRDSQGEIRVELEAEQSGGGSRHTRREAAPSPLGVTTAIEDGIEARVMTWTTMNQPLSQEADRQPSLTFHQHDADPQSSVAAINNCQECENWWS
ncbi:unnamed protein product [Pleuronectes platessa]|uniref:Uncharacterized protein n=1 Tax=Pleuronectes platessa TaxID=8262 RepID=A0A9N7UBS4_PLEPL|nr:unnamed protein product [Pleuronectes platessa]